MKKRHLIINLLAVAVMTLCGLSNAQAAVGDFQIKCPSTFTRAGTLDRFRCSKVVQGRIQGMALCPPGFKRSGEYSNGRDRCSAILGRPNSRKIKCPPGLSIQVRRGQNDRCRQRPRTVKALPLLLPRP